MAEEDTLYLLSEVELRDLVHKLRARVEELEQAIVDLAGAVQRIGESEVNRPHANLLGLAMAQARLVLQDQQEEGSDG